MKNKETKLITCCSCRHPSEFNIVHEPPNYFVECLNCGRISIESKTENGAIKNWNYGKSERYPLSMPASIRRKHIDEWKYAKELLKY